MKVIKIALLVIAFSGCAGISVVRTAFRIEKVKKIGYLNLDYDTTRTTLYQKSNEAYLHALQTELNKHDFDRVEYIPIHSSYYHFNSDDIRGMIKERKLDGVIIAKSAYFSKTIKNNVHDNSYNLLFKLKMKLIGPQCQTLVEVMYDTPVESFTRQERLIERITHRNVQAMIRQYNSTSSLSSQ